MLHFQWIEIKWALNVWLFGIKNNIMKKKFQNLIFVKKINKKEGYVS
jgi:hypothetical protein